MNKNLLSGIFYSAAGSFWWGVLGVFYFKYTAFAGPLELVIHRTVWTAFCLFFTISFFSRWKYFFSIFNNKNKFLILCLSGFLIYVNWSVWIYAVVTERLVDASFGYYIFPILSVFLGHIFFREKLNKKKIISIILIIISIFYLLINLESIPWIGLSVAFTWSFYNLLRKKVDVKTDIGLFVETLLISPVALVLFYFITKNGLNDFNLSEPGIMFLLFLAGPMTLIPLFLYIRSVELAGLGTPGMIFFITPTCQFLLGIFYYNEFFDINKLMAFILIWIGVIIYLYDLYEENKKT